MTILFDRRTCALVAAIALWTLAPTSWSMAQDKKTADSKTEVKPDTTAKDTGLGEDGYLDSDGVKLHYVTAGKGPLLVLLHGFPDYWYTWRAQMPELAKHFQVVALDMRGYNMSDKPEGVDNYKMEKLVEDVANTVKHFKQEKAVIVGHDWGGMVAWSFAMAHPEMTDRLIILNLPHPRGLMRELANNPEQQKNSQYARNFQKPDAASQMMPGMLAFWVKDPEVRKTYIEAFTRSSMEGMLNYYKANYPQEPYTERRRNSRP